MNGAGSFIGISPELRNYLTAIEKAMAGDIVFKCTPAIVAPKPRSTAWTRTVTVTVETAGGIVHKWFNKAITTGVSIADTSTAGTATIPSTTLTFVEGKATVVITGDAQAWLNSETDTLTVAQATILGVTVAQKTSVETWTT